MPDRRPLEGVRVIDLTRILAGPFATMLLGDLGADVIKVERPGAGDDTRGWGPPFVGDTATYFLSVNRNKRGITLDLSTAEGKEVLWSLLDGADVVVSNFRAGTLTRLGFAWERVHARCPRLVDCRLSGYGEEAAFAAKPAYDLVMQAESGLMDVTGEPDRPPVKVGISIVDEVAGLYLVQGVLAALLQRERTGRGELVEVALHDAILSMFTYQAQQYLSAGVAPRRMGTSHPNLVPYRPFATSDGAIVVGVASEAQWQRLCSALRLEALVSDPRFAFNADRVRHREPLESMLAERLATATTDEWAGRMQEVDVPYGRVRSVAEALDAPETRERGLLRTLPDSGLTVVGPALRLGGHRPRAERRPPALGEHTDEVLEALGYDSVRRRELRDAGVI